MFPARLRVLICIGAGWAAVASACARSNSPDAGGDTALARDLALVSLRDSSRGGTAVGMPAAPVSQPGSVRSDSSLVATVGSRPAGTPKPAVPVARTKTVRSHGGLTGTAACESPRLADQNSCLRAEIAPDDGRLNHVYNAYLARLRAAPARRGGGAPAIAKLRISERAWFVYRDQECRRRNWGKEGTLWAPKRAACMKELAATRADELERLLRSR
ncbi:MAG: lysozyme inhibitor LprI family protein [Gemmatimonadaceae bacterium]